METDRPDLKEIRSFNRGVKWQRRQTKVLEQAAFERGFQAGLDEADRRLRCPSYEGDVEEMEFRWTEEAKEKWYEWHKG